MNEILTGTAILSLCLWLVAGVRIIRGNPWKYFWSPDGSTTGEPELPPVSIIIPARNEASTLPETLPTILNQQYPEFEVIVVNDQSTDQTSEILSKFDDPKLTILDGKPRPDSSWQGKPWAAHQGYKKARHDWLLFTDADISFPDQLVSSVIRSALDNPNTLHSLIPTTSCPGLLQKILVPLLGLFLSVLYPLSLVNDPDHPAALAAGGLMLFSRSLYENVGGHREVRQAIAEDRELARKVKSTGGSIWLRNCKELTTTMYETASETIEGITKHLLEGLENRVSYLLILELLLVVTHGLPWLGLVPGIEMSITGWSAFGLAMVAGHSLSIGIHSQLPHSSFWGFSLLPGLFIYGSLGWLAIYYHLFHGGPVWKQRQLSSRDQLES